MISTERADRTTFPIYLIGIPAVAVLYFATGQLGLFLAVPPGFATTIWPPSGIALGALLTFGRGLWPGIFIGSLVLNAVAGGAYSAETGFTADKLAIAAAIAAGSTLQALVARSLVTRFAGVPIALGSKRDIVTLFLLAAPLPCVIASSIGVTSLYLGGVVPMDNALGNWWTWWAGDVFGIVVFLPLILISPVNPHRLCWRGKSLGVLPVAAILTLLVPLALTFYSWKASHQYIYDRNKELFANLAEENEQAFFHRLDSYTQALFGSVGFFKGHETLTNDEWRTYVEALGLKDNLPGINGIGFIEYVRPGELDSFLAHVQRERPGFRLFPQTTGRPHFVIRNIEPIEINREALGLNIGFEDHRVEAAERARDSGQPAITRKIQLVQDRSDSPGFLLLLPMYRDGMPTRTVAERRAAHMGWVYAPLIGRRFMHNLTASQQQKLRLRVYDGEEETPEALIYDSQLSTADADLHSFTVRKRVDVKQQGWTLVWSSTPAFEKSIGRAEPVLILFGGLFVSGLFAVMLFFFVHRAETVRSLVEEKTRALAEREALYRLLAENSSDVISRIALNGTRRYVSPACKSMLGYTPDELQGTTSFRDFRGEDQIEIKETIGRLARGEIDRASGVYPRQRKDRSWIRVAIILQLVRDPATGRPMEIVSTTSDVTLSEQRAEELRLAKEEADSAKAKAEQANEAKTAFLASMSHEIRTPLNAIVGFTNIILDTRRDVDDSLRRQLHLIQTSGAMLLSIVNDILDFSRIEAGEIKLDPRPFLLSDTISKTASIVQPLIEQKDLQFSVEINPSAPAWYYGDDHRLAQILLNLLNNARKFTNRGSIRLLVNCTMETPDCDRIHVAVADTGVGIPADKNDRLFKRFSQVEDSIQRRYGGSGLGLAISKQLVDLMGGKIGVESVEGQGSTFWFELTLPISPPQPQLMPGTDQALSPCGLKILLVEDLDINQEIVVETLRVQNHEIDAVSNGQAAIDAVGRKDYDLVLMDIQMPGMDGITATEHIRRLPGNAGTIPIIAMTANVLPQQVERIKAAGMNDHIGKPFDKSDLLRVIAHWAPSATRDAVAVPGSRPGTNDDEPEVFNRAVFDDVRATLGDRKMKLCVQSLDDLIDGIGAIRRAANVDRTEIARHAHRLVSTAGMLGFMQLSNLAIRLEEACNADQHIEERMVEVARAGSTAKLDMEERLSTVQPEPDRLRK